MSDHPPSSPPAPGPKTSSGRTPTTTPTPRLAKAKDSNNSALSSDTIQQATTSHNIASSPMHPSHTRRSSRTKGLVDISRLLSQPKNIVDVPPTNNSNADEQQPVSSTTYPKQIRRDSAQENDDPIVNNLKNSTPKLPKPREPKKCPLFCCFYAEFDIIKGPIVGFQSPKQFMDQDIDISTEQIHDILRKTFDSIRPQAPQTEKDCIVPVKDNVHEHTKSTSKQTLKPKINTSYSSLSDHYDGNTSATPTSPKSREVSGTDSGISSSTISIFDSTSEYIITGNELAGKMISLSTHHMHILTRPTVIANQKYERNALLFCVGFVIRRTEDPRPFRPLLSKWAEVLRSMEVESQFLTKPTSRQQLQPMLDRLLVSLNSTKSECNLWLDSANVLNLKLFRPPKPLAPPVLDHWVPVLLRNERQIQAYDWDFAIFFVIMQIDGVSNAKMISEKSEVDIEMVRACLRVLRHHGVIDFVDMFFYTNRYEPTEKAAAMLAGKEPKLLQGAFDFVSKYHYHLDSQTSPSPDTSSHGPGSVPGGSQHIPAHSPHGSSSPARSFSPTPILNVSSFPPTKVNSLTGSLKSFQEPYMTGSLNREQKKMKAALAELYCAFSRTRTFGDLWVALTSRSVSKEYMPINNTTIKQDSTTSAGDEHLSPTKNFSRSLESSRQDFLHTHRKRSASIENEMTSPQRDKQSSHQEKRESLHSIDWKEVFMYFDHRRLVTFGVVHGLLRRVHNFPLALDYNNEALAYANGPQPEIVGEHIQQDSRFVDLTNNPSGSMSFNQHPRKRNSLSHEELRCLVVQVVSSMDGTICDDELVCKFRFPFDKLLDLAKTLGKKEISSVFAAAPSLQSAL